LNWQKYPVPTRQEVDFDLDSDDAVAEVEGDVEGRGVSPGLEDFVAVTEGVGDEAGFDPLVALFESLENLEFVHPAPEVWTSPAKSVAKRKGAAWGPRLIFFKFYPIVLLYHTEKGKRDIFQDLFAQCSEQLKIDRVLPGY
jgi:hypothetical protein